jgi:hypothetical protein
MPRKNPAYITSDVLLRCKGVNLMGSAEISHLGVATRSSRLEDMSVGISMVQLPSRRVNTTRDIYSGRSDGGILR